MEVREEYIYKCINNRAHSPRTCWHPVYPDPHLVGISHSSTAWVPGNRACQHTKDAPRQDNSPNLRRNRPRPAENCRDVIIYKASATTPAHAELGALTRFKLYHKAQLGRRSDVHIIKLLLRDCLLTSDRHNVVTTQILGALLVFQREKNLLFSYACGEVTFWDV
jgi:hypothetical protein